MLLLFWHTAEVSAPVPTMLGGGGGQEDIERYKAYKRNLEAKREHAEDLRERLAKAEQEKQRKAKAKAQSKAKQAIEARILRFAREIQETEAQINALMLELSILEATVNHLAILDQRRRLLLVALTM